MRTALNSPPAAPAPPKKPGAKAKSKASAPARGPEINKGHTRKELHVDNLPIDQKAPITDIPQDFDGDIVVADRMPNRAYADELAFMEEPMVIRLEPSTDKNAATTFPVWNNGKGAEIMVNRKWVEITYLPVGRQFVTKRKYVEQIIRAKIDTINTEVEQQKDENPINKINRFTSAVHSFSIIRDDNPRGPAWVEEMRRRNF